MSTATERLTASLPVDVARHFESTITQARLTNNTFLGSPDDRDTISGFIEDAENEFSDATERAYRIGRQGIKGNRPTFEEQSYKLPGHQSYRARFSQFSFAYDYDEVTIHLDEDRVLPFDTSEGDELYVYRGLSGSTTWEDISDEQGTIWELVDHRGGKLNVDPNELYRSMFGTARGVSKAGGLDKLRLQISYRYGSLGGSRGFSTTTFLDEQITDTQTGTVDVTDGDQLPTGGISGPTVLLIDEEYVTADPDPANDQIDLLERGVRGTSGSSHDSGSRINYTPASIRKAISARAGMQLIGSGRYNAQAPDTDLSIDSGDMYSNLETIWFNTIEAMS